MVVERLLYTMIYAACRVKAAHSFLVGLCDCEYGMLREAAYNATSDYTYTLRKEV